MNKRDKFDETRIRKRNDDGALDEWVREREREREEDAEGRMEEIGSKEREGRN